MTLFTSLFGSFLNNDPFYDGDNEIPKLSIIETLIGSSHGHRRRVSYVPEVERARPCTRFNVSFEYLEFHPYPIKSQFYAVRIELGLAD